MTKAMNKNGMNSVGAGIGNILTPIPTIEKKESPLWEKVARVEEELKSATQTIGEIRATLMVNFGPNGKNAPGIVNDKMTLNKMLFDVLSFLTKPKEG